jgi:tetratricopeptide (TPR) repeat protein
MKEKCIVCNKARGKRRCAMKDRAVVCPRCCAEIRTQECKGCSYYQSAEKYDAQKDVKSGEKEFLVEINKEVEQQVDQALILVEKGRVDEAEKSLNELLAKYPKNYIVQYGMGTLNAFSGRVEESIAYFRKATEIFPYFLEAHYNLGIAYQKKFEISEMVRSHRKVIEYGDPEDQLVAMAKESISSIERILKENNGLDLDTYITAHDKFNKSMEFMEAEEWEKAIPILQETIELNGYFPHGFGNIGICYAKLGRKDEAIAAFDRAIEIDPEYEPAIVNKMATESLEEGEILDAGVKITRYYEEKLKK